MGPLQAGRQQRKSKSLGLEQVSTYRKTPKISPGAYIFQRPFLRGLFLEGLIFGGGYLRREICVSKSIELVLQLEVNLPFLLCFTLYLRAIFQVPPGAYIWRGDLREDFIHGRAYFPNFTVSTGTNKCMWFRVH